MTFEKLEFKDENGEMVNTLYINIEDISVASFSIDEGGNQAAKLVLRSNSESVTISFGYDNHEAWTKLKTMFEK